MTNDIETGKGLLAIAQTFNATNCALVASDLRINSKSEKYYPICVAGECVPVAYQSTEVAAAFMGHISRIARDCADFPYQPQMRIGESFKGCKVLVYPDCNSLFKPAENVTCKDFPTDAAPEDSGAYKAICCIGEQAKEVEAKILLIEDATAFVGDSPQQALALLNSLANAQQIMIFAGFKISEESEIINSYLFNYCHNLIKLVESGIEMVTEDEGQTVKRFFSVLYGNPNSNFVVYGIDEQGNTIIPAKVAQMLLMGACGKMFARKPVSKTIFLNNVFGALEGQFNKQTINNWLALAVEAGILCQSGTAGKSTISLAGEDTTKKKPAYSGNIAITAKGNQYDASTKHTKKRKPLCRIGQFKLLSPALGCSVNPVKNLTIELIKMVATGKPALDFQIKTSHRNCLVIMLADPKAGEWMQTHIGALAKDATFNVVCISENKTDGELLQIFREKINSLQPDFCFILNLDRVVYSLYTSDQLAKEFAITAKSKGVTTIGQTATYIEDLLGCCDFEGDEYWIVRQLIDDDTAEEIHRYHGYNITLPRIFSFEATQGKMAFLCRFIDTRPSQTLATAKDQKRAFYTATFFRCYKTPCSDICEDCTGKPLTNSVLYQAQKAGFIRIDYTSPKRCYRESVVTFVGK